MYLKMLGKGPQLKTTTFKAKSRKLGQQPILTKKGPLKKRGTKNFTTPCSIPFLRVLHQNKVLYNFHKRRQRLIARHIRSLN